MSLTERQIALRKGGNYATLDAFFDRRKVIPLPFNETSVVTAAGVNTMNIDITLVVAGTLAIGTGTTESGGLFATILPGAVGTGSTNSTSDSLGNILNMVSIRDATTHDPILDSGREVFALVQAVSTAVDGDVIAASGAPNTQLSFAHIASDGTVTLSLVTATIEFGQNNVYLERNVPTIMLEGGNPDADAIGGLTLGATQGEYIVTTAFAAVEVITLATGAGAASGVTTFTGDALALGASASAFFNDHLIQVMINGVEARKGTDVIWDSSATMHFALALDIGDYFEIRRLAQSETIIDKQ